LHTAYIILHAAGALTANSQCIHNEFIALAQWYWVRVFREFHPHCTSAENPMEHDPTGLDVINLSAVFEKMVASA
jgi:hypothetical protein